MNNWVQFTEQKSRCETDGAQPKKKRCICLNSKTTSQNLGVRLSNVPSRSAAALVGFGTMVACSPVAHAADTTPDAGPTPAPVLGIPQLLVAGAGVLAVGGGAMYFLGLRSLARQLLISSLRCTIQLVVLGSLVLDRLFSTQQPLVVFAWIGLAGLVAAHEASNRVEYSYPALRQHMRISIIVGGLSILAFALIGGALGHLDPWYSPRTLITVAAMLLHNTLTASSLGGTALTREFALHRDQIELRLSRGATVREAALPLIQSSLLAALTPTINALATVGIVSMPGMMTGQILAGQSARQAAAYQVMIMFLITASACLMVLLLAGLITKEMFDLKRHALDTRPTRPGEEAHQHDYDSSGISRIFDAWLFILSLFGIRIGKAARHQPSISEASNAEISDAEQGSQLPPLRTFTQEDIRGITWKASPLKRNTGFIAMFTQAADTTPLLGNGNAKHPLSITSLLIKRTNIRISLTIRPGERIGISGRSGVGKSQLLRTISGIEIPGDSDGIVSLDNWSLGETEFPAWRRHVCWVAQDRPTIGGSPNDFFKEVKKYSCRSAENGIPACKSPIDIAAEWGLSSALMDRPWSSLSGGEAQRASLAIALALEPSALLADEPTSACDEATVKKMEATLSSCEIPMLIVTHSEEQLSRFCTHHLELH